MTSSRPIVLWPAAAAAVLVPGYWLTLAVFAVVVGMIALRRDEPQRREE